MPQRDGDQFSAEALPPDEIAALKELERENRDRGASGGIQGGAGYPLPPGRTHFGSCSTSPRGYRSVSSPLQ